MIWSTHACTHVIKSLLNNTEREKKLYSNCTGAFKTDTVSIGLCLTEIVKHLHNKLPLKAVMILNDDVTNEALFYLSSNIITLSHITLEEAIIATPCWSCDSKHSSANENQTAIAIPIDLKIKVALVEQQQAHNSNVSCQAISPINDEAGTEELYKNDSMHEVDSQAHFYEEIGPKLMPNDGKIMSSHELYKKLNTTTGQ